MPAPTGKTDQLTVTDAATTEVKALNNTKRITVGEDPSVSGWPTTDFLVMKPNSNDDPRQVPMGGSYIFERTNGLILKDTIVGYIKSVSGTTTFFYDESGI